MPIPAPASSNVDVWTVPFDQPKTVVEKCVAVLCGSEVERANRFVTADLRSKFAVGRGVLRHLMGRCTGQSPASLEIHAGPQGKPYIPYSGWQFNVSHSGSLMVCAATRVAPLGIDIERVHDFSDLLGIASRYFAPAEAQRLTALPPLQRTHAFFECWTRKEAFIKATGLGLSQGLDAFEVSFGPGVTPRLLRLDDPEESARCWELQAFEPGAGYCGAVAIRSQNVELAFHDFSPALVMSAEPAARLDGAKQQLLESLS